MDILGRPAEAATVARFAEQVPTGPVGLLIEGEPGIGKTTVLLEAVRAARERRPPEPDRLSVVATRVGPKTKWMEVSRSNCR
jgi:Cdc6-like AAA superfamily ATPase